MSDAGHEGRAWRHHVQDMIDFARRAVAYTQGKTQVDFVADALTYDATLRNLELIGEVATHIPNRVREAHPEIPWRAIVGVRNRLAHGYLGIVTHTSATSSCVASAPHAPSRRPCA